MAHDISNNGSGTVPIAQILRSRADFPGCRLSYEVQFSALDWCGISRLASVCANAGLELLSLRCFANGRALCVLADNAHADLHEFGADFDTLAPVASWTINIIYGRDPDREPLQSQAA